jgi:CBS domain-containing protein
MCMGSAADTPKDEPRATAEALPISTLTVMESDGSAHRVLLVFCPMHDRTLSIETCIACPMCAGLDASGGQASRPSVACTFDAPKPSGSARPAATVLSRFAVCVRVDAVAAALPPRPAGLVPVVDADMRFVGVLEGPRVRLDDAGAEVAIEEHVPIPAALARMAHKRARQVPVVARDGSLVGVLDDLDALRALRENGPRAGR